MWSSASAEVDISTGPDSPGGTSNSSNGSLSYSLYAYVAQDETLPSVAYASAVIKSSADCPGSITGTHSSSSSSSATWGDVQ